jgi:hypothetical protein
VPVARSLRPGAAALALLLAAAAAAVPAGAAVSVYVVLEEPRLPTAALAATRPGAAAAARLAAIAAQQEALAPMLAALEGREQARFRHLANAVQVAVPADRLAEIAALPGVARVDRAGVYSLRNATSVPFTGAPGAWQLGPGLGEGVSIGIIDSGIDYLHAAFGGPGRASDYNGNDPTVVETGTFPTTRVVGGRDFVGDSYNGGSDTVLRPDPDPLDCGGHGTHVAGTAAGSGVLLSGATYGGPYTAGLDPLQFLIGPGVAPRARLYALKVFGCTGSTGLRSLSLDKPALASTRLTVDSETPTLRAIWTCSMWRRRSSMMSSALPGSMDLGERAGREEASTRADSPPARKRPSHLRAVGGVTPCSAAAWVKLSPSNVIWRTISSRRAYVSRACL